MLITQASSTWLFNVDASTLANHVTEIREITCEFAQNEITECRCIYTYVQFIIVDNITSGLKSSVTSSFLGPHECFDWDLRWKASPNLRRFRGDQANVLQFFSFALGKHVKKIIEICTLQITNPSSRYNPSINMMHGHKMMAKCMVCDLAIEWHMITGDLPPSSSVTSAPTNPAPTWEVKVTEWPGGTVAMFCSLE